MFLPQRAGIIYCRKNYVKVGYSRGKKKMQKKKKIGFLMAVCLLLIGCSQSPEAEALPPEESASIVEFTRVSEAKNGQNIYVILKSYHGNYWEKVIDGVCTAAKDVDEAVYLGGIDNETDIEGQISLMDQAIEQGADAILLAPVDSTCLVETCARARGNGIPVILIDSAINTDDYDMCFMTDNMEAGKMAAREMIIMLKEKKHPETEPLKIGILMSTDTSQAMVNRVSGFLEYWADYAPEQWEIAEDILLNGGDIEKAQKDAETLLQENKDIKGIFGCNNTSTIGISKTIMKEERTDFVMVGFDLADETRSLIQKSEYSAVSMLQNQDQMGYLGILSLDAFLRGKTLQQKYYDTGVTVIDSDFLMEKDVS